MIKITFFRKFFLQNHSLKVPVKNIRNRILNLFNRSTGTICILKKINTSNLAAMYSFSIERSFSVIHQLKLTVDNTEINSTRAGFYVINPALILCVKV